MRAADIIKKKRDGEVLSAPEINFMIQGYMKGDIPDYQVSSFLMAVFFRGMSDEETVALTQAMAESGERLQLEGVQGLKIDKHSTGGVGDKTSLIIAPVVAAMGLKMPKIAGRGLGFTGGTIDKLASIPGLKTEITERELTEELKTVGFAIVSQNERIAPADRKLYALRDVTATTDSLPLIAASIMSKKISEGLDALVLDVTTGSGAFMKTGEDAEELARLMVKIGNNAGIKTIALITDMDMPLGRAIGNSLEVKECLSALKGKGSQDLMDLSLTICAYMAHLADSVSEETSPRKLKDDLLKKYKDEVMDYIEHGDAFKKFVEFIDAQHGNPEAAFNLSLLPRAAHVQPVVSPAKGFIKKIDAGHAGHASVLLGAGRNKMGEEIDVAAGIVLSKKPGDPVEAGEPIAVLHSNKPETFKEAGEVFLSGIEIGAREPARGKLVHDVIL